MTFLAMALRFRTTGRGCMGMGGHRSPGTDETAEMRREIHALRAEVDRLKATR